MGVHSGQSEEDYPDIELRSLRLANPCAEEGRVVPTERCEVTREEAALRGLSHFWTGKPCKSGHVSSRYVSNRQCVACNREKARAREALRAGHDPAFRMYRSVHRRSGQALRGRASPAKVLGCDGKTLRRHIESKFTVGMEWDLYGQWEVDHVVPLSAARSLAEVVELCHYENLQPLWKRENQMKGGA